MALIFSVIRLLLPHVTDYGDKIRSQLAHQLGIPVSIKTVDAEMWWLSPRLKLTDVDIFAADGDRQLLHVNEILVGFDWLASIRQHQLQLGFISFNGTSLQVWHLADGSWQIQGIALPAPSAGPLQIPPELLGLLQDTSVYLHDIELDWRDELRNSQHLQVSDVNISLLNDAPYHEAAIDLQLPPAYGGHVRILAEINGPIDQPAQWQGRLYTAVNALQLKPWFNDYWQLFDFTGDGQLDANVWLDWQQLQVQQVHAYVKGEQLALHYLQQDVNSWKLNQLIGNVRWQQLTQGWQLDVSGLEIHRQHEHWRQPSVLTLSMDKQQRQLKLRASYLQMDDLTYLAGLGNSFLRASAQDWNTPLQAWQPRGELFDVDLQLPLDQPENLFFSSRFDDLAFSSQQAGIPSLSGLDGRIAFQNKQSRLLLDSRDVSLNFKTLFRQPLMLQRLNADVFVSHDAARSEIYAADIAATSPDITTHSRLHIVAEKDAPIFMDLLTGYSQGTATATGKYLPTGIMGESTVAWLDRALQSGTVTQGGFLFYGQLQDFPFNNNRGVMLAQFEVQHGQLDYQTDWPVINDLSARLRFHNSSMLIDQASGTVLGAKLENTQVSIDNFEQPLLVIKGEATAALADMVKYVAASPLNQPLAFVSALDVTGNANLGLDLQIPLAGDDDAIKVNGRLTLNGNELFLPDLGYRFKGVNGELQFTEASLAAERVRASLDGYPLSLRIDPIEIGGIAHSHIVVQGFAPLASLLAPLPDWKPKVAGGSDWQVTLDLPMTDRPDGVLLAVAASGEMRGVASQLPLFLAKSADTPGTLRFGLDLLAGDDMNIRASLSGVYDATAQRRHQHWQVTADSALLRGTASFMENLDSDDVLHIDLERLDLAALQASQEDPVVVAKKTPPDDALLASKIPPLKVQIARLDWGKVQLHNIDLQTHRVADGMAIDVVKLQGPEFSLEGKGSWLSAWRMPHLSRFDFNVKASNLGASLSRMGLADSVQKTHGEAEFHLRWPDAPQHFDWNIVAGNARMNLQDGRIQHVNAGAGRLLGIFNFRTLLALDFGDQVRDGFAFDEVTANYTFANGNAYSDDFKIQSKVAEIDMQGRIGLVKEDFDQTITVIPGVGNTLTLIGAVAGGPVTGVLVHVFQKLLGVDNIVRYKYTVQGSWDKPNVTLLDAPKHTNNEFNEP